MFTPLRRGYRGVARNVNWGAPLPCPLQCSRIRIFRFFQISKKHDFLRFFEMAYQKVVKSHQQKFLLFRPLYDDDDDDDDANITK